MSRFKKRSLPGSLAAWVVCIPVLCASLGACGAGEVQSVAGELTPDNDSNLTTGAALASLENPPDPANILTGIFIDERVSGLSYVAGEIEGKTNNQGEYRYRAGDTVQFSIGGLKFPEIAAKAIITPLDLYKTDDVEHLAVTNIARLLQALDEDSVAENGIQIRTDADDILQSVGVEALENQGFESAVTAAFLSYGAELEEITPQGIALTHLSNSLIKYDLAATAAVVAGTTTRTDSDSGSSTLLDFDRDLVADIFDTDDDNDGVLDESDAFPLDETESSDIDADGIGDNTDTDNDNDGVLDLEDEFPTDASEAYDYDFDGIGDNKDSDDDNDGVPDQSDAFPFDPDESSDMDGDGIGDKVDDDNDNDGVRDVIDLFPLDPSEWSDNDLDSIGDNADPDDDNDSVVDELDAFPLDPLESGDIDSDGIGDSVDIDNDNDGVPDVKDTFPTDPYEYVDFDGDGIGDNEDTDDDGDGTSDWNDDWTPLFTIDMNSALSPSSCLNYIGSRYGYGCSNDHLITSDKEAPSEITILNSALTIHGNVVNHEFAIALNFERLYSYYRTTRSIRLVVEGLELSMNKWDPESVTVEISEGAKLHAVSTDNNLITTGVTIDVEKDMLVTSGEGVIALNTDKIEEYLRPHGVVSYLKYPGDWALTTVLTNIDFYTFYSAPYWTASTHLPREKNFTVGDIKITGYGLGGSIYNQKN